MRYVTLNQTDIITSCVAIGTDVLGTYIDENKPVEEMVDTMFGLVKSGKIRYIGLSNRKTYRIEKFNEYYKNDYKFGIDKK